MWVLAIGSYPNDYMPKHTAVSRLVFDAAFKRKENKSAKLVPIYHIDTLSGVNFTPTEYVDILIISS